MSTFKGVIIEESLDNKDLIKDISIIHTKVKKKHKTPWVTHWTMHNVEIPENKAGEIANEISESLNSRRIWYADFKNGEYHYIVK